MEGLLIADNSLLQMKITSFFSTYKKKKKKDNNTKATETFFHHTHFAIYLLGLTIGGSMPRVVQSTHTTFSIMTWAWDMGESSFTLSTHIT